MAVVIILFALSLPNKLFDSPYSSVILSENQQLLGAKIAQDGQWRFTPMHEVPSKFSKAILAYEDQYFYIHWGINPISILKAIKANLKAKKVVAGASTITQQTIRLHWGNSKRTYSQKILETLQAMRLELTYSKNEILALYASHAPFGGNVVGLPMAAWRYYGLDPEDLSWSQAATLAVLPNAPSLIYPGKNQDILLVKRNKLLLKLYKKRVIDSLTYQLALKEPLVDKAHNIPQIAPHLLEHLAKKNPQATITTTIDYSLQKRINQIIESYYKNYMQSNIHNISAIVINVKTNQVISYIGNTPTTQEFQKDVDNILSKRSTGSILKPFLAASMLDDSQLLPKSLVKDIPVVISGYKPQNHSHIYNGAVSLDQALSRSLNIPFVLMLQDYGINRFYDQLKKLDFQSINKHPNHYGLSLILGGAESSLWEITRAYSNLAYTLNYYNQNNGLYPDFIKRDLNLQATDTIVEPKSQKEPNFMGAAAIYNTFMALTQVTRPEDDQAWQYYDSSVKIAWKTGTSFGARDAWAVGLNPDYVVGVWVGNSSGEGRPSISGVRMAGPILFDIFKLLPKTNWFEAPLQDMYSEKVCQISGYIATELCPTTTQLIANRKKKAPICSFHHLVHLDWQGKYQVNSSCVDTDQIHTTSWFVLPPTMAYYYQQQNSQYKILPEFRSDCIATNTQNTLSFIYPKHQDKIHLAKGFNSKTQPFVAKVATTNSKDTLYWYLDQQYLGKTIFKHDKSILATTGEYWLRVVNQNGQSKTIQVSID
ncbi:penicillin-binding protein 1C [Myroides sp. LJL110]